MDKTIVLIIAGAVAIIVALLFSSNVRARLGFFKLDTENRRMTNKLKMDGEENRVRQGGGTDNEKRIVSNRAEVKGNRNDIEQK